MNIVLQITLYFLLFSKQAAAGKSWYEYKYPKRPVPPTLANGQKNLILMEKLRRISSSYNGFGLGLG